MLKKVSVIVICLIFNPKVSCNDKLNALPAVKSNVPNVSKSNLFLISDLPVLFEDLFISIMYSGAIVIWLYNFDNDPLPLPPCSNIVCPSSFNRKLTKSLLLLFPNDISLNIILNSELNRQINDNEILKSS